MAVYISLIKESEDAQGVIYQDESEQNLGKIYFDKTQGVIKENQSIPEQKFDYLLVRAEIKLRQHWQKGHFPDKTRWAS